jgi:glycosyltransferase involved in cell wall biosynthesis
LRTLVLLTDAFGGRGGIAKFNRDLLNALCSYRNTEQIVALPRTMVSATTSEALPARLSYEVGAARGKTAYLWHLLKLPLKYKHFDGIICGHLHLLPAAVQAARRYGAPLTLIIHGVEAWQPPHVPVIRRSLEFVDSFVAVSDFTKQRFLAWSGLRYEQGHVIPNCVDVSLYGPGPKPLRLIDRYGLYDRRVIMTLARLSAAERYKGVDEVLEVMPELVRQMPDLVYLVLGDGDDRARLQSKARALSVADNVLFGGYIAEHEKADHYRLADAFVMPGRGEGFGIVYLEAMACGIPVVASKADASREAVLDGRLGLIADPGNRNEIIDAIQQAIALPRRVAPDLNYFSFKNFVHRWHAYLDGQDPAACPEQHIEEMAAH